MRPARTGPKRVTVHIETAKVVSKVSQGCFEANEVHTPGSEEICVG